MMFAFRAILLNVLTSVLVAGRHTAIVYTTTGPVQGEKLETVVNSVEYAAFTGIRFGKPPVGYLRFKPPVPVDPWTEVLNATSPGNECPQLDKLTKKFTGNEDCLFLSVLTPVTKLAPSKKPLELKSVMVWIHGGAFISGSQSDTKYYADYLLERDVVYVAINYRLGALGFLSLDHENATGNAGLKDQVLALKWVKSNIEKFGGNPNNVTIFGESAGAVSVGFHVLSESSAGLFHGAISMSGTPLVPWGFSGPKSSVSRAWKLGELLGHNSTDKDTFLETLYATSAQELVEKGVAVNPATPFPPTLENVTIATDPFISECIVNKYNTGNFTKVPQMLGFMEHETGAFLSHALGKAANVATSVAGFAVDFAVSKTSMVAFKAPIDATQRLLVAGTDDLPVYYYKFTYARKGAIHNVEYDLNYVGAAHGDDLAYVFHVPLIDKRNPNDPLALNIYRISTMWTNFAKYGNPTPDWVNTYPLGVAWPPSGCEGKALQIGKILKVVPRPIDIMTKGYVVANDFFLGRRYGCTSSTTKPTCRQEPPKETQKKTSSWYSYLIPG